MLWKVLQPMSLTKKELTILGHYAQGKTAPEIAKELFVTVQTIRSHGKGIRRKLKSKTIAGAVAEGHRRGILPIQEDK